MKANLVHVPNPFDPIKSSKGIELNSKMTINQGIKNLYPNFKGFEKPTICLVNNKPLLRKYWNRQIKNNDNIVFMTIYRGGDDGSARAILTIVVIIVATIYGGPLGGSLGFTTTTAGVTTVTAAGTAIGTAIITVAGTLLVNAVLPPPELTGPSPANNTNPATVYNINAQGNAARLEQVIPVIYGRHLVYPDFAHNPYTEYIDNEQHLYELFVIGIGEYDIEEVRIEDTAISTFKEVEWRKYEPYQPILPWTGAADDDESNRLIVRTHVVTAAEVNNLELEAEREWFGPFAVVGPTFKIEEFSIDIALSGLAEIDNSGNNQSHSVSYGIEYRLIDEEGNPQGNYITAADDTITLATLDPVRRTLRYSVPLGRYEVRMQRRSEKSDNSRIRDQLYWGALKGYVEPSGYTLSDQNDPDNLNKDLTMLAVKIRATSNISGTSARKINCIVTRKLRVLEENDEGNKIWSIPKPTTDIAWALADICTADYGGRLSYNRINQDKLTELSEKWSARGDTFNAVLDRKLSLWEALTTTARAGRSLPIMVGGTVTFIRDELREIPSALFSSQNMIKDTLTFNYIVPSENIVDKVSVKYFDHKTWTPTIVEVADIDGEESISALSPEIDVFGVTNRAQAEREGVYLVRTNKLRRKTISFETELEGSLVTYGDDIILSHDTSEWGLSGTIVGLDSTGKFKTSIPLNEHNYPDYSVVFRNKDGSLLQNARNGHTEFAVSSYDEKGFFLAGGFYKGGIDVNPIITSFEFNTEEREEILTVFEPTFDSAGGEGTFFSFGREHIKARVLSVTPSINKTFAISAVEQDDAIHVSENVIDRELIDPDGLVDEDDPDVTVIEHIISEDQLNYNLFESVGSPPSGVIVNCTINDGVVIGSISPNSPAFLIEGFHSSSRIYLINNGRIYGAGGYEGIQGVHGSGVGGSGGFGTDGNDAGDAIRTSSVLTIDNTNGYIFGGGGGGGGGGGAGVYGRSSRQISGGGTCVPGWTLILMANGEWKQIQHIRVGESIQGRTKVNVVQAYDRVILRNHRTPKLFEINNAYQNTDDHLTLLDTGWSVLNKENYGLYNNQVLDCVYDENLKKVPMLFKGFPEEQVSVYGVGDNIATGFNNEYREIESITEITGIDLDQTVYSLVADGDGTMIVNGGYVLSAWSDEDKWKS